MTGPRERSPIRATEHTVEDRLPPRIRIRRNAPLEMPHIMIFMDDADNIVFSSVTKGEKVYDFELMQDGGSITGWLVADTEKACKGCRKARRRSRFAAQVRLGG